MASAQLARKMERSEERRSLTSTVPGDSAPPSHAWLSDRPSWCVDLGPTLRAMATCEVWLSLAKGELSPETKVWREGMAHWDRLDRVPEFALALPDVDAWGPVSATVPKGSARTEEMVFSPDAGEEPVKTLAARLEEDREEWPLEALLPEVPAPEEIAAREATSIRGAEKRAETSAGAARRESEPLVAGVATMVPPSDFTTPAPVVVDEPGAPRPVLRSRRRLSGLDRKGALSVAFGAAVAITALVMATTGPVPGRTTAPNGLDSRPFAASAPERGVTFQMAQPPLAAPGEAREPAEMQGDRSAGSAAAERDRAREPRGPHAADRGQQRRARGGVSR